MHFTQAQTKAIKERNKNMLVLAGAGSGKTAVLVNRILSLLEEKECESDELLVITFTKAAAMEMKMRIRKSLIGKIREGKDRDYFYRQLEKLEKAQISTVHAFCLKLIRMYYQIIECDPSFTMLTEEETVLLKEESIEEVFDKYYEESDRDFLTFCDWYATLTGDRELKQCVYRLYDQSSSLVNKWDFFKECVGKFSLSKEEYLETEEMLFMHKYAEDSLEQSELLSEKALQLCIEDEQSPNSIESYTEFTASIKKAREVLDNDFSLFFTEVQNISIPSRARIKSTSSSDRIKLLKDEAKDIVEKLQSLFAFSYDKYHELLQQAEPSMRILVKLLEDYDHTYRLKKEKRRGVDYQDLEDMALRILENEEVRKEVQESYRYIFVDEYQDTNPMQDCIVNYVKREDNLFVVGDVKQSIYRFRQAEPKLFLHKSEMYQKEEGSEVVFMNDNFRSSNTIIDGVNVIFDTIMRQNTAGIAYRENERLCGNSPFYPKRPVCVDLVGYDSTEKDKESAQAEYLAELIEDLLSKDIYDTNLQVMRKTRPGDIAVLDRSMNRYAKSFSDALKRRNIPSKSENTLCFYDELEISLMYDFLSVIDNYKNDLALLGVMRSFLYGFTADDLVRIRLSFPNHTHFYEAAFLYRTHGEDVETKQKVEKLFFELAHYNELSRRLSIEKLLFVLYEEKNILSFFSSLPGGENRFLNLEKLQTLARNYEHSTFKGLYHFLLNIKRSKLFNTHDIETKKQDGQDKIQLLTIHKSKGLEFPIVIVTGCMNRFNKQDMKNAILFDKEFGLCPNTVNPEKMYYAETFSKNALKVKLERDNMQEEMRILYVAATRAKEQLFFVAPIPFDKQQKYVEKYAKKLSDYEISECSQYIGWILSAVASTGDVELKDGEIHFANEYFSLNTRTLKSAQTCEVKPVLSFDEFKASFDEKEFTDTFGLSKQLSYVYPYPKSIVPTKLTVSEIKEENTLPLGEKFIRLEEIPSFMRRERRFTPAQKGSIVHLVLEEIDLSQLKDINDEGKMMECVEQQLNIIEDRGLLSEEEKEVVDRTKLAKFFLSEIGQKLLYAQEVKREKAFLLSKPAKDISSDFGESEDEILIQGMIDCYFVYDDELYLIDYKTDYVKTEQDLEKRNEIYSTQLNLYKEALEIALNRKIDKKIIVYINMEKVVSV